MSINIDKPVDFRDTLFEELQRRKASNPGYSLRRFAKFLATDPSFLTKLFQKKRNITIPVMKKFGKRLGMDEDELTRLHLQKFKTDSSSELKRKKSALRVKRNRIIVEKKHRVLHWYSFVILELLTIDGFKGTPKNIASALGTTTDHVESSLEHLEKIRLIERTPTGEVKPLGEHNSLFSEISDPELSLSRIFTEMHLKSISSFTKVPRKNRRHLGLFVAIPSSRVPEAKKMIDQFRDRFESTIQRPGKRDAIFYFGTAFFPLFEM